jgi:hypothetical protein
MSQSNDKSQVEPKVERRQAVGQRQNQVKKTLKARRGTNNSQCNLHLTISAHLQVSPHLISSHLQVKFIPNTHNNNDNHHTKRNHPPIQIAPPSRILVSSTLQRNQLRLQGHLDIIVYMHHLRGKFWHWREGQE